MGGDHDSEDGGESGKLFPSLEAEVDDDDNDEDFNDGDGKRRATKSPSKRGKTNSADRDENHERLSIVIFHDGEYVEITKKHPNAGEQFHVPSADKKAFYWNFFHIGTKTTETKDSLGRNTVEKCPVAVCNLCCQIIGIAKRNYGSLEKHLCSSIHRDLYSHACMEYNVTSSMMESRRRKTLERGSTAKRFSPVKKKVKVDYDLSIQNQDNAVELFSDVKKISTQEVAKEKADLSLAALDAHVKFWADTFTPIARFNSNPFHEMLHLVAQCGRKGADYSFHQVKIKNRTSKLAEMGRDYIRKQLKDQLVSLTIDHWKSCRGKIFSSLTVQFIDDEFVLRNFVLEVHHYDGWTSTERIATDFRRQLLDVWKIEDKNISFLVTDTAVNINTSGVSLEKRTDDLVEHVYCIDRILQLIANIAFRLEVNGLQIGTLRDISEGGSDDEDETNGTGDSVIRKVYRLVKFFKGSVGAKEALKEVTPPREQVQCTMLFTLVEDKIAQWWSALTIMEIFLKMKNCIIKLFYTTEIAKLKNWTGRTKNLTSKAVPELPSAEEWDVLENFKILLSPIKEAQKALSTKKFVTSSLVIPYLITISKGLDKVCDQSHLNESVKYLAREMKDEFSRHFRDLQRQLTTEGFVRGDHQRRLFLHPSFYKAYALDPRTKSMKLLDPNVQIKIWDILLDEMLRMGPIPQQKADGGNLTVPSVESVGEGTTGYISPLKKRRKVNAEFEVGAFIAQLLDGENEGSADGNHDDHASFAFVCRKEIEKFQKLDGLRMYYVRGEKKIVHDPLQSWWNAKANEFPNLWRLARKYLALPATAATWERACSIAGFVGDETMIPSSSLSTLFDLHFLRENWAIVDGELN